MCMQQELLGSYPLYEEQNIFTFTIIYSYVFHLYSFSIYFLLFSLRGPREQYCDYDV